MVHWSPFVMSFKKKYPWIQLAGHAGNATLRNFAWGRLALWGVTLHLWEGRAWPWNALGQVLSENWQWQLQPYLPDVALMLPGNCTRTTTLSRVDARPRLCRS